MPAQRPSSRESLVFCLVLGLCAGCSTAASPPGGPADVGTVDAGVADAGAGDAVGADAGDAQADVAKDVQASDTATQTDATTTQDAPDAGPDASTADAPTFAEVQKVALSGCSGFGPMGCHSKEPFGGGLDLRPDKAWASLVGVDSMAHPGILRVKPFSPQESMLYRKLVNQLADDGSEGNPMPKGEAMIWQQPKYVGMVSDWIAAGAKND
jgi:hypothetical protein